MANFSRLRWDLHSRRVDALCLEISDVSDQASDYWLSPMQAYQLKAGRRVKQGPSGELHSLALEEDRSAAAVTLVELKIVAAQTRISADGARVRAEFSTSEAERYDDLISSFFIAMSTGDFKDREGTIEVTRAAEIQTLSAQLTTLIRTASEQYFTLANVLWLRKAGRAVESAWMIYGFPKKY